MVITGVIRPPPEIRAVADRTALYVAKNGRAFEARILNSDKGKTPKFSFLQPTSPFHAYYEDRIQAYETENTSEPSSSTTNNDDQLDGVKQQQRDEDHRQESLKASGDANKSQDKQQSIVIDKTQRVASAIEPIAKALLDQRAKISQARAKQEEEAKLAEQRQEDQGNVNENSKPPAKTILPPPPPLELVHIVAPGSLSVAQIETIQLVAQITALDSSGSRGSSTGGQFLQQLSLREWNNSAFAFCQPRHAHFAYFSALVDAYRRIFNVWTSAAASAKKDSKHKSKTADEPSATSTTNGSKAELSKVQEIMDRMQIALEQAAYRSEYENDWQKRKSQQQEEERELNAIDWHDFVVVETIDFGVNEAVELSMLPPSPSLLSTPTLLDTAMETASPSAAVAVARPTKDDGMQESEDDDDEDEEETIRVVPSFTPKVVATSNPQTARAIDPITGKSVSVADMPEHMRIQLLDPKWAEERKKFQEKQKDSNLVSGDAIANNISRFAQARGDLFGKSEQELLTNEMDSKRRLEEANRIIREQSHQGQQFQSASVSGSVGPSLQVPQSKRPMEHPTESAAKRIRPNTSITMGAPPPPPPPPPPPGFEGAVPALVSSPRIEHPTAGDTSLGYGGRATTAAMGMQPTAGLMPTTTAAPTVAADPLPDSNILTDTSKVLPEAEFAASLITPEVTLQIRIPNDPSQMAWNFYGQILSITVNVMSKVKVVKEELAQLHLNGMPANKIQFKEPNKGFLKDAMTLAAHNVGPTATLELTLKTRGGRK